MSHIIYIVVEETTQFISHKCHELKNMSLLNVKLQFLCAICHNKCHILYIVMEETITTYIT